MALASVTIRLDHDLDPVVIGARSGLLWAHGQFALAGIGEARRLPVTTSAEVAHVSEFLDHTTTADEVGAAGTGAVAFGALPFDRTAQGEMVVPEIVVGRDAEGRRWMTVVSTTAPGVAEVASALDRLNELASNAAPPTSQPTEFRLRSMLEPEVWRDEIVAVARDRIRSGELGKAVLARELVLTTDHPVDSAAVLERLRRAYRSAILFSVDGFIGASPELLVSRSGDIVRAHPLAGTAPRSSDPGSDQRLGADLLASQKDLGEHRITIDWLLDTLLPFCSYVDAEPEPTLVTLANVHHLGTRVEGRLSDPPASALELVGALHPTPAVGGDPQGKALELIAELERTDRGRYAGPTGWVDAAGNGAFAVSVRSAQISGTEARIFAGVGVVADSDPQAELAETRSKFQAMLGALITP
ncbi:MAG: isochorismate synthase [Acidimicrobiales bacterium]|jgi:isochorismate synthase